jgi:hypothetical protein
MTAISDQNDVPPSSSGVVNGRFQRDQRDS